MIEVRWRGVEAPSMERCRIAEGSEGVHVVGVIDAATWRCQYELHAAPDWRFRTLSATAGGRTVVVARLDQGWIVDGEPRPDLHEALEVDISASPLSNTLPIRRLGLAVGESADITTAYVAVPELTVATDPQRYTRLGEREYLYESRDSDFRRAITVDEHGLVIDYPGLFERDAGGPPELR